MKLQRSVGHHPQNLILVPLVNVLVLVLAFLTLSGVFVSQPGISITPPFTSFVLGPQHNPQIVSIASGAVPIIYFQEKKVTPPELDEILSRGEEGGGRSLIIRADSAVPHGIVTQVMEIGLQRGFSVAIAGASEGSNR